MQIKPDELVKMFIDKYGDKYKEEHNINKGTLPNVVRSQFKYIVYIISTCKLVCVRLKYIGRFGPNYWKIKKVLTSWKNRPLNYQQFVDYIEENKKWEK